MQKGPQMSRAMYREFFKPRQAKMWRRAKELADVKVMLHCCGGVRPLLPDLIEAGLDAINPVQISCTGMDAAGLKRDFGDSITFWGGGCDTRFILSQGTPEEIGKHVRGQVSVSCPGRRLRFSAGPQYFGRRAAGERHCHVRRREFLSGTAKMSAADPGFFRQMAAKKAIMKRRAKSGQVGEEPSR